MNDPLCQDLSRCGGRHAAPGGEGEGPRARRPHRPGAAAAEQGGRREGDDYFFLNYFLSIFL